MVGQQALLAPWLKVHSRDSVLFLNHKLKHLSVAGHFERILDVYRRLRFSDIKPDRFTFPYVLKACAFTRDSREGEVVHAQILRAGFGFQVFVANSLVDMYGRLRLLASARQVFDDMPHRNHVSWNMMISGYGVNGFPEMALGFCNVMRRQGLELDAVGFKIVISICAHGGALRHGESFHARVIVSGLSLHTSIVTAILDTYAKCGSLLAAEELFDELLHKDVVTWNAMISGYLQMGKPDVALQLFDKSMVEGIKPSRPTILMSLKGCCQLSAIHMGKTIHGYIKKAGFSRDVFVEGLIVDMYSKSGELDSAWRAFSEGTTGSVESWSAMIHGLGMHGLGKASLMCFFNMLKRGIDPDGVCFLLVLSSCSHNKLVEEGCSIFYYMVEHFKIMPEMEHYACLIDLLGRGGFVNDAYRFICGMPVEPDGDVLGAFLGACRVHDNCEMGKFILEQLVHRGCLRAGYYKLLMGVFVSRERWNDVSRIRSLMGEYNLKGPSGCSLIIED